MLARGMSGMARPFESIVPGMVRMLGTDLSAKPAWLLVALGTKGTSVDLGFPNLKNGDNNTILEGWLCDCLA